MTPEIRDYIFGQMQSVAGWFRIPDAIVFDALAAIQKTMGVKGSMAEIGIYFGASYFMLAKLTGPGEAVFAADLFEQKSPVAGLDQREYFESNARRFGVEVPAHAVYAGDTARLDPALIVRAVGPVRLFHVDGGHYLHHLATDCAIADASLADDGVIVFDDYANNYWPEVTAGVFDFLRANRDRYAIFCVTHTKLYACRRARHADYLAAVRTSPRLRTFLRQTIKILGDEVIHCAAARKREWPAFVLQRLGMSWWSRFLYRTAA